jgi:hypothetical protein
MGSSIFNDSFSLTTTVTSVSFPWTMLFSSYESFASKFYTSFCDFGFNFGRNVHYESSFCFISIVTWFCLILDLLSH